LELVALLKQGLPQLRIVVDLAIEDNANCFVFVPHRLIAGGVKPLNCQPDVAHAAVRAGHHAEVIRATVCDLPEHGLNLIGMPLGIGGEQMP
jgi:hypothetical protein